MDRSRALSRLLLALPVLAAAASAAFAQPLPSPVPERVRERLAVVESLAAASRIDTALAVLQPALREARRHGDRRSVVALLQEQGELIERQGGDAARVAREALDLASGGRDTIGMMGGLALLGPRSIEHDGIVEPAVEWLLRIALERDDRRFESRARSIIGAGWLADGQLEPARRSYARAVELARLAGDWRAELTALSGLGHVALAMGDLDRAREEHRKVERIAADRRADLERGRALRDLARIEIEVGDLDAAVDDDHQAAAALRVAGVSDWVDPALEAASVQTHLDLAADAESTLAQIAAACDSLGRSADRGRALAQRAEALERARRPSDAAAVAREGLGLGRALALPERARLTAALATVLQDQDSAAAGLAILDRELRANGRRLPTASRLDLETARAGLLETLGRSREALDGYGRARRMAPAIPAWRTAILLAGMARGELAQGRVDRAAARLDEAARAGSLDRTIPSDLDEAERRASAERSLRFLLVHVARSGADSVGRMRAAFDTLQAARSRSVLESTLGPREVGELPAALTRGAPPLDSLQRAVLREGEVLLDLWLGTPRSFLFAVTRDSFRCVDLPEDREMIRRVRAHAGLAGRAADADPAAWDSSSARLGAAILGGVADLLAGSRRILLVTDGELAALPVAALILPGSAASPSPLGVTHEIERLPSAAWIAGTRSPLAPSAGRMLAVAGPGDEEGASRPSAVAELEDLRSRWRDVRVEASDRNTPRLTPDRLQGSALLHLLIRGRLDDLHPWFSGLLVERASATEADPWWRAFQVAQSRLDARLVVLPACEPARAHSAAEGGAAALATAVLCAGADAVIVNLWPLDPASTARWTEAFDQGLARGETAAQAMLSARRTLRADPSTRAPSFWAGFVLYGNGDVRVPLRARPRWWWPTLAGSGIVIAALALVAGARRRRRRDVEPVI